MDFISKNIIWLLTITLALGGILATVNSVDKVTDDNCTRLNKLEINAVRVNKIEGDINEIKSDIKEIKGLLYKPKI